MSDNQKPGMLTLEPREVIVFEGPFNRSVCKSLEIGNPSKNQKVIFKLKTTTPRSFLVRPNIGIVEPDTKITVDIFMQPIVPNAGQKQDKFLIQAAFVSDANIDLQKFWKEQKLEDIWEAKIKCALVQQKSSDEQLRQAGGATSAPDPKADGEIKFDAEGVSEPVAQLIKKVSMLEDERLVLKEELDVLRDQSVQQKSKKSKMDFFLISSCIFTIMVAIVGAYYGKHFF